MALQITMVWSMTIGKQKTKKNKELKAIELEPIEAMAWFAKDVDSLLTTKFAPCI